jgi:Zn-dependent peptidase ImmA (M78 family)
MVCARANSSVIRWARKNSGRSIEEIARRLSLSLDSYVAVEAGTHHLTLSQLRNFSGLVKRPLATFYLRSAPPDVKKPRDYRASTGSVGREAMLSFRKAQRVQDLSGVPFADDSPLFRIQARLDQSAATVATRAREAVGLTADQQVRFRSSKEFTDWLVQALAGLGVHVLFHAYSTDDSKAYSLEGTPPVVVVNRRDFLNSQLFSLLHELCHLLLRRPGMCDTIGSGGPSNVETYCNRFASHFILPTDWFRQVIQRYDPEDIRGEDALDALAKRFSTSRDVVLLRLVDMGLADSSDYAQMRSQWAAQAIAARKNRKGGRTSVKANALNDNGGLFVSEVADAYASNRLGVVEASELLGINPGYVTEVVGVPGGVG